MTKSEPTVVLLRETVLQSWLRDLSTLVLCVSLIGIGIFLHSSVLQFVGAIIAFTLITVCSTGIRAKYTRTIAEAREILDKLEAR